MNKKDKKDIYESKWEVFLRNYNQVPGFKAFIQLLGYFLFFIIFIIIINIGGTKDTTTSTEESTTTTTQVSSLSYKEILDNFSKSNKTIEFSSEINGSITKISAELNDNIITGLMESESGIKKFKISESQVYEIQLDTENINDNLFTSNQLSFLVPSTLVSILESNQATKRINDKQIIYNYNINYSDIIYDTIVVVEESKITSITLSSDNIKYVINYQ
jgi:hypothetical protein